MNPSVDWSTDEVRAQDSIHLSVESVLNAGRLGSKLSTHDLWATFQIQIIAGCLLLFRCSVFVYCFQSQIMILFQCKTYHIWLECGSSGGCSSCWKAFLITQIQSSGMVRSDHSCLSFYISIWERNLPTVFETDHPNESISLLPNMFGMFLEAMGDMEGKPRLIREHMWQKASNNHKGILIHIFSAPKAQGIVIDIVNNIKLCYIHFLLWSAIEYSQSVEKMFHRVILEL